LRVVAGCREEVDELAALLLLRQSRAERVPEEIERRVLVRAAPVVVRAVHDAALLLVELEAALRQP
jgi:hypothetical protein